MPSLIAQLIERRVPIDFVSVPGRVIKFSPEPEDDEDRTLGVELRSRTIGDRILELLTVVETASEPEITKSVKSDHRNVIAIIKLLQNQGKLVSFESATGRTLYSLPFKAE